MQDAPPIPAVQQVAAQAVRGTLGRGTDVDACTALVSRVDQLLEQAAQQLQQPGAALACRIGCSFCCHLRVMVLPHEAIALFRYLQSQMPADRAQRVRAKLREYTNAGAEVPSRRPCAFLVEGACAAYEVRPSACAAYHSLSRERCEQSFHDPGLPGAAVALESLWAVAVALEDGMKEALQTQGLSRTPVELHAALAALLADPALIARWRSGRPLLKAPTRDK
ncbi:MAG TPA: YkgJ family cysteine cluster protein [Steroidobacteraceae bacterium]|nr:YkgJ family cysteine cluster protein [Steroidobacteraceae bacterium]